ncbi:hypothetical protein FHS10_003096 [Mucilaginibacter dorajii]|nr:hypothetical protein [Mucilaginibacter dorajii]
MVFRKVVEVTPEGIGKYVERMPEGVGKVSGGWG